MSLQDNKRINILVVDDEPNLLEIYTFKLEKSGYEVITADSAESALSLLKNPDQQINLIITDLQLPEGSGVSVAEWGIEHNLPVIIATAYGKTSKFDIPEKAQILNKPFNLKDLTDVLNVALKA